MVCCAPPERPVFSKTTPSPRQLAGTGVVVQLGSGVGASTYHWYLSGMPSGSSEPEPLRIRRLSAVTVALKLAAGMRFWLRRNTPLERRTSAGRFVASVSTKRLVRTFVTRCTSVELYEKTARF